METFSKNAFLNNSFDARTNEKKTIKVYVDKINRDYSNNSISNNNLRTNAGKSKLDQLDFEEEPKSSFLLRNINTLLSTKLKKEDIDSISFENRKNKEEKHIFLNSLYGFKNSLLR